MVCGFIRCLALPCLALVEVDNKDQEKDDAMEN